MCAHITVPWDELLMTQSPLYLSHALGLSPELIASSDLARKKRRLERGGTQIFMNSSFPKCIGFFISHLQDTPILLELIDREHSLNFN